MNKIIPIFFLRGFILYFFKNMWIAYIVFGIYVIYDNISLLLIIFLSKAFPAASSPWFDVCWLIIKIFIYFTSSLLF